MKIQSSSETRIYLNLDEVQSILCQHLGVSTSDTRLHQEERGCTLSLLQETSDIRHVTGDPNQFRTSTNPQSSQPPTMEEPEVGNQTQTDAEETSAPLTEPEAEAKPEAPAKAPSSVSSRVPPPTPRPSKTN